jgi:hypothetical protein
MGATVVGKIQPSQKSVIMHQGFGADLHYTIIRETSFQEKMEAFVQNYKRLAEFETALDWALARKPHGFTQYFSDVYFLVTEDLGEFGIPSLRILYLIDSVHRKVLLIDVDLKE